MTIIDFHTHFFPENLFQAIWRWFDKYAWDIQHKIPSEELIKKLKTLGVTQMVLLNYAHKPGMSERLNQWTSDFSKTHPEVIPFGTVHPRDKDVKKIMTQCFEEYGFYGIKVHGHVSGVAIDDPASFPIYERIEAAQKLLMLHGGQGPSLKGYSKVTANVTGFQRVKTILKHFPKLKLIIPHLGADEFDDFFDLMEDSPNLWMDTTMALAEYFPKSPSLERIEKLSDRILYGSDAPNIPYPLDTEIKNIRAWFPADIQKKLFFTNAQKLLGMQK